jgi:hypothetical protein
VAKPILIEQFHLTVLAPPGLPEADYDRISAAVREPRFRADLRRAARAVVRTVPMLRKARVTLTR